MKSPMRLAKAEDVRAIGLAPAAEEERKPRLLAKLKELRGSMRSLAVMLDTCVKCGNCVRQCHSYLGTGDPLNAPPARADLMRKLYRRHFTLAGRLLGRITGAEDFDAQTLDAWLTYFYQCNECRRCAVFCPLGVDTAEVTIAGRHLLSELGMVPRFMQQVALNLQKTGNNMGIPKPALLDSVEFLQCEMLEETGLAVKIPVDQAGSEILYIPSSADFFTNVDTIIGVAKMFHALGASWTISSAVLEAANFGLLFNDSAMRAHNRRMRQAAEELGAELVLQGECGHGWRAARLCTEAASGPVRFRLMHVLDYTARNLGRLALRRLSMRVALHDPCNYARAGDLIDEPRRILRACVEELVELAPNREETFCCGGGSGILMDEMMEIRLKLGKKKAEQIQAAGRIDYLAAGCSICKAQLPHVAAHYGMPDLAIGGVMDLVGKAMDMNRSTGGV
ncbi:MAG: (Fe-S)-binding protein [Pirellulales bacterium]|nr:(Fe-S)-binding protein [Pirellulales bacterium]